MQHIMETMTVVGRETFFYFACIGMIEGVEPKQFSEVGGVQ